MRNRNPLQTAQRFAGVSALALGAAFALPQTASAQNALQGTPSVQSGSVTFGGGSFSDVITVASNQAVINWAPFDTTGTGLIDFLPQIADVTFKNDATLANDFTVLNRVLPTDPTRAIALNGTLVSRFEDMVSGALTPGGGVWFYSPGGIVVGGTATIDVGRLALTTADPFRDAGGNFITGGNAIFQTAVSGTGVYVNNGSTITLSPENSYIALVAPHVRQAGSVTVNGSAAYVGAEAATITVNQGLFNIAITQGTDGVLQDGAQTAVSHQGSTTGPASTGVGDNHRIYMVAVPKNTAVSMVIQASAPLGFDIAGAADVDGNAVVLSAGQGVNDRTFDPTPGSTQPIDLNLINTSVTSALHMQSSDVSRVQANTGPMNFASTARIQGNNVADVQAVGINSSLNFSNGVIVSADKAITGGAATLVGGAGGAVNVTGDASISANAVAPTAFGVPAPPVTFQGGTTLVQANGGGTVSITGNLFNSADALAATYNAAGDGNNAVGGNARFFVNDAGSSAQVDGNVTMSAVGFGSGSLISGTGVNGNGTGGLVELNADASTGGTNSLTINGDVTVDASGFGANTLIGTGGNGLGGVASFGAGAGSTVTAGADLSVFASGIGGNFLTTGFGAGGAASGGTARITIFGAGGTLNAITGVTTVDAAGFGGTGAGGGIGGEGTGGDALVFAPQGSITLGTTTVSALGSSGSGGNASIASGGIASVIAEGTGAITLGNTVIAADGSGSGNPVGIGFLSLARGGDTLLTSRGAATLIVNGTVDVTSNATGPTTLTNGVTGGNMQGGSANLIVENTATATITGAVRVFADATASPVSGPSSAAGSAQGGLANLSVNNTAQLTIGGLTRVAAFGNGGLSINGPSGNGTGGTSNIQVNGGTLTINNTAQAVSRGNGGADAVSTQGGNAQGGNARIVANGAGGLITITGAALVDTNAQAGFGLNGGNATGGTSAISQGTGGRVAITGNATVTADASGAIDNGGGDGIAGFGRGGDARITVNDNTVTIGSNALVSASGQGGGGSSGVMTGGAGFGGLANIGAQVSTLTIAGTASVSANGVGGNSGATGGGGAGTGGQALVGVTNGAASLISIGTNLTANASGTGGTAAGTGFTSGAATGGTAQTFAAQGQMRTIAGNVQVTAVGNSGAATAGASVGNANGGFAQIVGNGGLVTVVGNANTTAAATSGSVASGTGAGGNATGGNATIGGFGMTGTVNISGSTTASAGSVAGSVTGGTAGLSRGGVANVVAGLGNMAIGGNASASTFANGANASGSNAGAAIGGTSTIGISDGGNGVMTIGGTANPDARSRGGQATNGNGGNSTGGTARLQALGGTITISGGANLGASALGGSAVTSGNGGNATSGNTTVVAQNGALVVNGTVSTGLPTVPPVGLFVFSGAQGGAGAGSGSGGNAVGAILPAPFTEGGAQIGALNGTIRPSAITAQSAFLVSAATGGAGGSGGATGGNGGNAVGGSAIAVGLAGNGALNIGGGTGGLVAFSTGATGGAGGAGTTQGGNGGSATAGFNIFGTETGVDTPTTTGSATLGTIVAESSARGGAGGSGGTTGAGGNGGTATGGINFMVARGTTVTTGNVSMIGNANGGNGGLGTTQGLGGNATAGSTAIAATQRVNHSERGRLNAGIVTGDAIAVGGTGRVAGQTFTNNGSGLEVTQSDARFGGLQLSVIGDAPVNPAAINPSYFRVVEGTATVLGDLIFSTTSDQSIVLDAGQANVTGAAIFNANRIVLSPVIPAPTLGGGTIFADRVGLTTVGDITTTANFGTRNDLIVFAQNGGVTMNNTGSGGDTVIEAGGGSITLTSAVSLDDITLDSTGNVTAGDLTAGDSVTAFAGGNIAVGLLSAGLVNPSTEPDAEYGIGLAATGNVSFTSATAAGSIGLASDTGSITGGEVNAGQHVLALAGANVTLDKVQGGTGASDYVYIANSSMFPLGGTIDNFDPTPIFAAPPVRSGGSVTINGTLSGGNVIGASGTGFTVTSDVSASQRLLLDNGGVTTLGGTVTSPLVEVGSNGGVTVQGATTAQSALYKTTTGAVQLGDVSAFTLNVDSGGLGTVGNIVATTALTLKTGGNLTTGSISAPSVAITLPTGNITTGAIVSAAGVRLTTAAGNLTTGNVIASSGIIVDASGDATLGTLSAGLVNPVTTPGFNPDVSVTADGSVTVTSAAAARDIDLVATVGNVSSGDLNAGRHVLALAGNNIALGGIQAGTGATDFIYLANSSMASLAITPTGGFNPAAIFATAPVRAAGSIQLAGPVTGGNLIAGSAQGFRALQDVTASQRVEVSTGGVAGIGGLVSSPIIRIVSSDLSFTTTGRLGTTATQTLSLTSDRGAPIILGGASGANGYQIDSSEGQRLTAQAINVSAGSVEIRDLTLNGSAAASGINLAGANGRLSVQASSGISVTGAFAVNSMANTNEVVLTAPNVSVVTDRGSVILSGNSPGGILTINANDIHVASQANLSQLSSSLTFAGRDATLGRGTGLGTPTIQARQINFNPGRSLLIQNNGTATSFAGFNAYTGGVRITPSASTTPLDMVIFGSLVDSATGLVTNSSAVRDLVVGTGLGLTLTSNSAINGCLITASACITENNEVVPILTSIEDRVEETDEEAEERKKKEEEEIIIEKAASASPIMPPVTIIDSRPMIPQPILDDPITGGGNPTLIGAGIAPSTAGETRP